MLSLALLGIPALVPGVMLRLELCCTLEVSVGLSVQSWQLILLFPACFGVGSIYCCFMLHVCQVTLLQQLQLSSLLFIFSAE